MIEHGTCTFATVAMVLVVLWALRLVTAYALSGSIHILLVPAVFVVLIRVIRGRTII